MNYKIVQAYREDEKLRHSLNRLATETFGLSFENWYQSGYWREAYIPYSIVITDEIVSNVSINKIDCEVNGKRKHYIQIGTVMTQKNYRKKGYGRILMEKVLQEYADCDGFFLYANDSVLDFYPKFGFRAVNEYRYQTENTSIKEKTAKAVLLNSREDYAHFLKKKNERVSNGVVNLHTDDLMMFYLTQFMSEDVYYIEALECYVIAEIEKETLRLFDVFSVKPVEMSDVYEAFGSAIKKVQFLFTPKDKYNLIKYKHKEENTTLFVLGNELIKDMDEICAFPEIAHA